ncbi:2Fe-2S iron-sulfur cluster-binding protein [Sphingobium xenophagum]|uniref:2Fe-2S iron-sulfur cluster-binding protein n=1 Tax=Sphingobium xenophagum TaxID=121428 RepID=UPI0012FDB92C|nr:2Fe-2S iron-sulfur cluster binding domain-containing protein [Sphingobium xenophagum]
MTDLQSNTAPGRTHFIVSAVVEEFIISIPSLDARFTCRSDQTILKAMIGQGLKPLAIGCRNGGCGVCRIRIQSGDHHSLPMSRSRVSTADEAAGIRLACRVYPASDLLIEPMPLTSLSLGKSQCRAA